MNLVPFRETQAWESFRQLNREMDQLMRRFFSEPSEPGQAGLMAWTPRVDVEEDEKQYIVKADLPGVDPKSVEIDLAENVLTLRGHRREEREDKKKNYRRIERFEGQFYREIPLPRGIDQDKIEARSVNGVLTITIPKGAEMLPKKITVKDGR